MDKIVSFERRFSILNRDMKNVKTYDEFVILLKERKKLDKEYLKWVIKR